MHLGALGIVTRVTLDVQPTYLVRQDVYDDLPWDALLSDFEAISSAGYSVSVFTELGRADRAQRLGEVAHGRGPRHPGVPVRSGARPASRRA